MTTERLLRILGALRLAKHVVEVLMVGAVAYAIACGGPLDTRPIALALLVLASVGIDVRDHIRLVSRRIR